MQRIKRTVPFTRVRASALRQGFHCSGTSELSGRLAPARRHVFTVLLALTGALSVIHQPSAHAAPTRSDMLVRAQSWVDARVGYNTKAWYQNQFGSYRQDCSGYVSMVWNLPISYVTSSLPSVSHSISKDELQPGDIMLSPIVDGHVVIFAGWSNNDRSKYWAYEQNSGSYKRAIKYEITYPYWPQDTRTYSPYRLNGIDQPRATAPSAPTKVSATAGVTSASVSWAAPSNDGGSVVTSYAVSSAPASSGCSVGAATFSCTITGLQPGTAYVFAVTASNAVGASPPAQSPAVTPKPGPPPSGSANGGKAITNPVSGLCVDVPGGLAWGEGYNQTPPAVQIYTCNSTGAQQWLYDSGTQSLRVFAAPNTRCLDISGGNQVNGAKVQVWQCNGTTAQTWTLGNDGTIKSTQGFCLDAKDRGKTSGTPLQLWQCPNPGPNQKWGGLSALTPPAPPRPQLVSVRPGADAAAPTMGTPCSKCNYIEVSVSGFAANTSYEVTFYGSYAGDPSRVWSGYWLRTGADGSFSGVPTRGDGRLARYGYWGCTVQASVGGVLSGPSVPWPIREYAICRQ